jgi:ferritin-like metal-binding protein YciE
MNLDSLTELFVEELKDVYDAEKQLLKALPKMSRAAFSDRLREAFDFHAEHTRGQVERLNKVFQALHIKPKTKRCSGMQGIIAEAEELMEEADAADPSLIDAGLIAAAQRAEHYEIATYGTLRTYAQTLGASGGKPISVKGTRKGGEAGILRIDFPGYSGGDSLEEISWDEFFAKFDEQNLTFLYQDETKAGKRSNFNKLICGK